MSKPAIQQECMRTRLSGEHDLSCAYPELSNYTKTIHASARPSAPPTPSAPLSVSSCAGESCSAPCASTTKATDLKIAAEKALSACKGIGPLHEDAIVLFRAQIAKVLAVTNS
jgi:hypothetical protein